MILGKKPDEEDANYKKMKEWEGQCDKAAAKLQAIGDDISELEKVRLFFYPFISLLQKLLQTLETKFKFVGHCKISQPAAFPLSGFSRRLA